MELTLQVVGAWLKRSYKPHNRREEAIARDPATRFRVAQILALCEGDDPVDAAADAELAAKLLADRAPDRSELGTFYSEWRDEPDEIADALRLVGIEANHLQHLRLAAPLTLAEWQRVPEEYRHVGKDGNPYVLCMDPKTGQTVLTPVAERVNSTEPKRDD